MVQGFNKSDISKRGLLKVDLRKAFNSVNWDFIIQILQTADFPPVFINWITQCLTMNSFSINVNRELCGFFKGTRDFCQGDSLSPSLFVIAMEAFSNLLSSKFDSGVIGFHQLARNPKVNSFGFCEWCDYIVWWTSSVSSRNLVHSW